MKNVKISAIRITRFNEKILKNLVKNSTMRPKESLIKEKQKELFRIELSQIVDLVRVRVKLSQVVD
jgi:hypothetical protein